MKRKTLAALGVAAALALGTVAGAAEATIVLQIPDGDPIEVANTAELGIKAVSVEAAEEEGLADITMVSEDGAEYVFEDVKYGDMLEPELVVEGAFAYIKYTGLASGKERSAAQSGELTYDSPAELFAVDDVYIRSEPDSDSEILGVINRGDAIEVLGETATHYKVKKDETEGYTVRKCISEDEQEAIAAVKAEEAARAEIQRQAEAAAQAAAQAAAAQSSASQSSGSSKKEVKRQKFDDCDGSGHGYYEITYSDGSTSYEEY